MRPSRVWSCLLLVVLGLLGSARAWSQDFTTGLVGHWKLDAGTGTTAADEINANTLDLINTPTWVAGQVGPGAISFLQSSAERLTRQITSANALWMGTQNWTVMGWIKLTAVTNVDRGIAGTWNGQDVFWYWRLDSNNLQAFNIRLNSTTAVGCTANTAMTGTAWRHVAVAVVRSGTATFYTDGTADGTCPVSSLQASNIVNATDTPFNIGNIGSGQAGNHFDGTIDEVRIFNRALSEADIDAHMAFTGASVRKRLLMLE